MKKSSKTNSATIMSPAGDDIYQDATPCTSDISTSVHVSIHIIALSSGPFFSLHFFYLLLLFHENALLFHSKMSSRRKNTQFFPHSLRSLRFNAKSSM